MNHAALGFCILVGYFLVLCMIGYITGRKNSNDDFFRAGRSSPWYVVAFGMIGVSLSGVTFLSVPGTVVKNQFSYLELLLGNMVGYWVMALVLLPLYYKMKLTSIYTYLKERLGPYSYRSGALCFISSRLVGASLRLFLVAVVLHEIIFAPLFDSHFAFTAFLSVLFIWIYTCKGGIKTVVYTDTLQTFFLLLALVYFIVTLPDQMNLSLTDSLSKVNDLGLTTVFEGWGRFSKSFFAGVFLAIAQNGLDQDMMQKNLTCPDLKSAQKNIFSFSFLFVIASTLFLVLGALLTLYAQENQLKLIGDSLFRGVVMFLDSPTGFVIFILGVVAAAYSTADSALASLTTSFCIDFLDIENKDEETQLQLRRITHIVFSVILVLIVIGFEALNNNDVVWTLFKIMGYTYGPLLGLFTFGLTTKRHVIDHYVPYIVLLSPLASYALNRYLLFNNIKIGVAILMINALITYILCHIYSKNNCDDLTIEN